MYQYSVIIPVLNEQDCVGDAIQSALDAGAHQIVAVDGGSRDRSLEIMHQLDCQVINAPRGRGTQLDAGAAAATGSVLVFLHADCRLSAECLNQIGRTLEADADAWGCFQQSIRASGRRFRWLERANMWRTRFRGLVYGDQCFWMSRDRYWRSGGFPRLPLMEDIVLSDRLRAAGRPVVLPGPVSISSRGWQRRGVVGQTIFNWWCFGLFRCGWSAESIAEWYRRPN